MTTAVGVPGEGGEGGAKRWPVRGHGNAPNKKLAAGLEPTTLFEVGSVGAASLKKDELRVAKAADAEAQHDTDLVRRIATLPPAPPGEKRGG